MRIFIGAALLFAGCCPEDSGKAEQDLSLDNLSPMQEILLGYCKDDPLDCEYLCRDLLRDVLPRAPENTVYECKLIDDAGVQKLHVVYYDGSLC